jgi:hypothetical protein
MTRSGRPSSRGTQLAGSEPLHAGGTSQRTSSMIAPLARTTVPGANAHNASCRFVRLWRRHRQ